MGRGNPAPPPPPPQPAFQPSVVKYGDKVVSKTFVDPQTNTIVSQYVPDPAEEERKRQTQLKINEIVHTLGQTAPELVEHYTQTEKAFVQDAKEKFQEQYNPALRSLREDVASRFGTLNNSQFISGLDKLENNRAKAIADITTKGKLLNQDMMNNNEARKLQELQALGATLNQTQQNLLNNTTQSMTASQALNDFLNSQWMNNLRSYTQNWNNSRQNSTALMNINPFGQFGKF